MMTRRYTHVRRYRSSGHGPCLRCSRPARVTAFRVTVSGYRLPVRYCTVHAEELHV